MSDVLAFPVVLAADSDGSLLVTVPALPEVTTFGVDRAAALERAAHAIEEALAARMADREPIPVPRAARRGQMLVVLRPLAALKVALYAAMRAARVSKAELGRRLGLHAPQVDRLLNLNHRSRFDQLEAALAVVGRRIVVRTEAA
jgi:antitoxin HicB